MKSLIQRITALLLTLLLTLLLALPALALAAPETREFTDSAGRTVILPASLDQIAVSGPLAQMALYALCPERLAGVASAWDEAALPFVPEAYRELPVLGQLYGGKGELNLETLLASGAQAVIDVGEPKKTVAEDLDALQTQTGVPFVHITATLATLGDAYRLLGELMGMPEEAERLAAYCERVYADTLALSQSVTKAKLLYVTGDQGLIVIAKGSYHAELIDLLAENLAVVDAPSAKGTGNETDMEQLMLWHPDVILFAPGSVYASVADDPVWSGLTAIQTGRYYEVPLGPYNWMGFPPSVQRLLGMRWMAKLLYPEAAAYDPYAEAAEYFRLFTHWELTQAQYDTLVARSLGKEASR